MVLSFILRGPSQVLSLSWWFLTILTLLRSLLSESLMNLHSVLCHLTLNYMPLFTAFSFKCTSIYMVNSSKRGNRAYTSVSTTYSWVYWTHNYPICSMNNCYQLVFNKQWIKILVIWKITKWPRKWNNISELGRTMPCLWKYYLCTIKIVQMKGRLQWKSWQDALKPFPVPKNVFQTF